MRIWLSDWRMPLVYGYTRPQLGWQDARQSCRRYEWVMGSTLHSALVVCCTQQWMIRRGLLQRPRWIWTDWAAESSAGSLRGAVALGQSWLRRQPPARRPLAAASRGAGRLRLVWDIDDTGTPLLTRIWCIQRWSTVLTYSVLGV